MRFDGYQTIKVLATLAIAGAGGLLASALSLPVAWLLGPMVAVAVASATGLDTRLPNALSQVAFFVLGVQAGSGVTPDVVGQIAIWPFSFAIQMVGVCLITLATYAYLHFGLKWNHETSLFASLPGALAFVVAAAEDTRTDMQRMLIVQTARLLLLIGALTPFLGWLEGGGATEAATRGEPGSPSQYALLFAVSLVAALLGRMLRIPGGLMLGALIGSAAIHASGVSEVAVPSAIALPCLVLLGTLIGSRLYGIERKALLSLMPISIVCFLIGIAFSALAGLLAVLTLPLEPGKVALAYSPGALEALTVLAFQFDIDPAYVAAHHVVRFMGIALIVPFLASRVKRRRARLEDQ
ncbi:AbrB family transcriptional regulator [Fulvimarina endophytica]|uniref:AbrB family transcriptional regulator n=2 Tax=Fulvimarina endophytica TaxID=2293836 RepID=A0A371X0F8_9HYPH|nr:AbrB family transcriptional regulator [Fulvimarina endophytica]